MEAVGVDTMKFLSKAILFIMFGLLFFAGCVNITYTHKINPDGSSTIEQAVDLTGYINYLKTSGTGGGGQGFDSSQLTLMCTAMAPQFTPGVECNVVGNVMTFKKTVSPQDGFYDFQTSGGLFGGKYKVVVNKIPAALFTKPSADSGLGGSGLTGGQSKDVVFTDKEANLQTANGAKTIGMNMTYIVEMPAPVTSATAGNYKAKVDGNKAVFDLIELFQVSDPGPIVVEAEGGTGMLMVIAVVVVVIIVLLLLWLFVFNKKK